MSDPIKHECGIALLRLKKPLKFYLDKYVCKFFYELEVELVHLRLHQDGVNSNYNQIGNCDSLTSNLIEINTS